jgi:hypothetical protein
MGGVAVDGVHLELKGNCGLVEFQVTGRARGVRTDLAVSPGTRGYQYTSIIRASIVHLTLVTDHHT